MRRVTDLQERALDGGDVSLTYAEDDARPLFAGQHRAGQREEEAEEAGVVEE